MKNKNLFKLIAAIAFLWVLPLGANAQVPTYVCELRNDVQLSPTEYQFDVYIVRTGTTAFEFASMQMGIRFNNEIIPAGATITPTITGLYDVNICNTNKQANISIASWGTPATKGIKVTLPVPACGTGNGTIISNVAPGNRVCQIKLTSSIPFTVNSQFNLSWWFGAPQPWNTAVFYYPLGLSSASCTNQPSHITTNLSNPALNAITPVPYAMGPGGAYCQGTGGLPVTVANSQNSFNYTLYKDGVATANVLAGTGSALNFGNQTAGIYKVKGTPGNFWMIDSTIITESPANAVSVALAVDQNNLCTPVPVTFTATPTNGGNAVYQWYLNGAAVGANQPTYTYTPANGQEVYVMMTSDVLCPTGNPATSSTITMNILPAVAASVGVAPDANNVCAGATVNFTATPTNGGTPTYQWYVGTSMVGTNSPTYSYAPANGDQVYCVMTSTAPCVTGSPATSATVAMVVNPLAPVSVSASPDQNNVCGGTSVTFTATPTNGGTPSYQWYKNSFPVGTNSATYTFVPANLDQVSVVMTSNLTCVSGNPATSGSTAMVVNTPSPVSVAVAASPAGLVCVNTLVTFTATPTNGGTTPVYQWYVGTTAVGTNQPTYAYMPSNNDQVKVVMTSNLSCISGSPSTSPIITEAVSPCTGIADNLADVSALVVYPNPSSDKLYVNFSELNDVPKAMKMFNALGQVCFESELPLQTNQNGIDVSSLSAGMYTLQIVFDNGTVNRQVVVKK